MNDCPFKLLLSKVTQVHLKTNRTLHFFFSNIKLSSPMINNVIIGGSILMYMGVFFTTFDYANLLPEFLNRNICMVGSLRDLMTRNNNQITVIEKSLAFFLQWEWWGKTDWFNPPWQFIFKYHIFPSF